MNNEIRFKCHICSNERIFSWDPDYLATAYRGVGSSVRKVALKIKAIFDDPTLDEANAWVDLPPCSICKTKYSYNIKTGERRP